jgi:hypothetical protein
MINVSIISQRLRTGLSERYKIVVNPPHTASGRKYRKLKVLVFQSL